MFGSPGKHMPRTHLGPKINNAQECPSLKGISVTDSTVGKESDKGIKDTIKKILIYILFHPKH
jgi:hypothetical protein